MELEELRKLLKQSWSKETSADPENWTRENPAWGQCVVTALIVQDFFGGELRRAFATFKKEGRPREWSHYWNRLPNGQEIDFTREQFPENVVISESEPQTKKYVLSFRQTRKRYALLRLAVENLIQPNPLFSDPIYRLCLETALESECQKMKFACLVIHKGKVIVKTSNKTLEPLRHLCQPECIRFKIQSRTESMLGACGHAEEWALHETIKLGITLQECSFYVAGFDAKTLQPWIKKETKDHTCLRCAVQLYMAGVEKIYVPFIDHWDFVTAEEAVKASVAYALKDKKIS